MTPLERQLLTVLIEECSEVIKGCTKALRFGLDDVHEDQTLPKWDLTPREEIRHELNDICGAVYMLRKHNVLPPYNGDDFAESQHKMRKIHTMLEYSHTHGELE